MVPQDGMWTLPTKMPTKMHDRIFNLAERLVAIVDQKVADGLNRPMWLGGAAPMSPGSYGGVVWSPMSVNPELGLTYTLSVHQPVIYYVETRRIREAFWQRWRYRNSAREVGASHRR